MQHDFILIDRSGSMTSQWTEAVNSVNSYVKKLADDKVVTGVTIAAFDQGPDGRLDFRAESQGERLTMNNCQAAIDLGPLALPLMALALPLMAFGLLAGFALVIWASNR